MIAARGYDTKYAMHCARLGFHCIELMLTGGVRLPIVGEPAEWLRAVRRGEVPFDDWWARSLDLDARLQLLNDDESLRRGPDRARIEAWSATAHLALWNGHRD